MKQISAYSIIIIGIISFAYFLPYFYSISSIEKKPIEIVYYSPVIEDFTIMEITERNKYTYKDRVGNTYTSNEFKEINPMIFHRDLYLNGIFPSIVGNNFVTIDEVQKQFEVVYFRPSEIITRLSSIKLYPMYESKGNTANLEFPKELFRINDKVEFIVGESRKINIEKSQEFTEALQKENFSFPAKIIGGNVDPKKRLDYGYFVSDSQNNIYRLYQEKGKAKVVKTPYDNSLGTPLYIYVKENPYAKHYGIVVTDTGKIYFILKNNYEIQQLNIDSFNPYEDVVRLFIDPINYTAKIISKNSERTFALDNNFNLISTFNQQVEDNYNVVMGKIFDVIFPFSIYDNRNNPAAPFKIVISENIIGVLIFSIILSIGYFIFISRKFGIDKYLFIDIVIILFTGIYGLLSIVILNKDRRQYFGFRTFS